MLACNVWEKEKEDVMEYGIQTERLFLRYMKYTNLPLVRSAMSWGCRLVEEYEDKENEITKVFAITREEWLALKQHDIL